MSGRSATETIRGFYYQFDYSILKILSSDNDTVSFDIEKIEDLDINTVDETTAVQCKYYSGTEYNHSVIAVPIRKMLKHYSQHLDQSLRYKLYGHFSSGQNKLTLPIDINFLKSHFLTYNHKNVQHEFQIDEPIDDNILTSFLGILDIDIYAATYESQFSEIQQLLCNLLSCTEFEADSLYYNSALRTIKELSIQRDDSKRRITKAKMVESISCKDTLFGIWYMNLKGNEKYCRIIKKKYFTQLNTSSPSIQHIKSIIYMLANKWSKISRRTADTYCAFVLFPQLCASGLKELKVQLYKEGFPIVDGYAFYGSDFCTDFLSVEPRYDNRIKIKFINTLDDLTEYLLFSAHRKEVYQFFTSQPVDLATTNCDLYISIYLKNIMDILGVL
jgi:hypothetical protein